MGPNSKLPPEFDGTLNTSDDLATFLTANGIQSQAVETLQNELVTGESLLKMSDDRLRSMGIKFGPIQELRSLIDSLTGEASASCGTPVQDVFIMGDGTVIPVTDKAKTKPQDSKDLSSSNQKKRKQDILEPENHDSSEEEYDFGPDEYMDVRKLVQDYDKRVEPQKRIETALDSGIVSKTQRSALVREVCNELKKTAPGKLYPSANHRLHAAKSIIHHFPKETAVSGVAWGQYYNEKGEGLISYRLRTIRRKDHKDKPEEKMRKVAPKKKNVGKKQNEPEVSNQLLSEADYKAKVSQVSLLPLQGNKKDIFNLMDETRPNRIKWIFASGDAGPSYLYEIFRKFNKFAYFQGELVFREFKMMFPKIDDGKLLAMFPSYYAQRIIYICWKLYPKFFHQTRDIPDENMRALILLAAILPSPNFMKSNSNPNKKSTIGSGKNKSSPNTVEFSSEKLPNENLIRFVDANDNLLKAPADKNVKGHIQPFLICATSGKERTGQYFVKADIDAMKVGTNSIKAFDILVKLHYCFDVKFAPDLEIFYNFISCIVMEMEKSEARPSSLTLATSLRSIEESHLLESDFINSCQSEYKDECLNADSDEEEEND